MQIQVTNRVVINAPAVKVWEVVAHEFGAIGQWASAIATSEAISEGSNQQGVEPEARVCTTNVPGFREVRETMTQYDEGAMQFSYQATEGRPWFVTRAENYWLVRSLGISMCEVEARAEVEISQFWGVLLAPLMRFQFKRMGNKTFEELKFYIEQGQIHPRKLKKTNPSLKKGY